MSAHVFHDGTYSALLGYIVTMQPNMSPTVETMPYSNTPFHEIMLSHDFALAPLVRSAAFVDLGLASFDSPPLGLQTPSELLPTPVHGRKYESQFDESHNSSALHRIFDFLHSGIYPRSPNLAHENLCLQSNYRGSGTCVSGLSQPGTGLDALYPLGLGHYGFGSVLFYSNEYVLYGMYPNGTFYPASWFPNYFRFSYTDWLRQMSFQDNHSVDPLRYEQTSSVSALRLGLGGISCLVSCTVRFTGNFSSVPCTYRWSYTLKFNGVSPPGFQRYLPIDDLYIFGNATYPFVWDKTLSIVNMVIECDVPGQDISIPAWGDVFDQVLGAAKAQTLSAKSVLPVSVDYQSLLLSETNRLTSCVMADLQNLKDASYLSTVDSVESMQRGTSSDILQTLAKLPDAASMIPKIKEFISLCSEIRHEPLNPTTLKDLVDLATSTNLQSNFQWQPFQRFITEQLPEVLRGIVAGWTRSSIVIGRGKFSYSFPTDYFGFPSARVTSRSKIVVDCGTSTAFAQVLGLDGLGILPKPSNLWDLIPLSFTINWMTGVGANIRRAENGLFLLVFPTYGVHSLTVEAGISSRSVEILDFSPDPTDPFRLRAYHRDVSRYIPLPTSGKYPFGLPIGPPPITLVASLLWQLLL